VRSGVARGLLYEAGEKRGLPMMLGILLTAIWLIATGLLPLTKGRLPQSATVLNVLAVVAGILLLLGR